MTKVGKTELNTGQTSSAPGMLHFPNFEPRILAPGMWRFPTNSEYCCIYRVPHRIRKVNPSAYRPQLVILGPLHHSLKVQAWKRQEEDIENTRFMGYLSMEEHKKSYLSAFAHRFYGEDTIGLFRSVIQGDAEAIRASYSELTTWMRSEDFIDMILHDSVFILEFILRCSKKGSIENAGDILMDQLLFNNTVYEDLMLLENQLPFFILQKLFDPIIQKLYEDETLTFRKIIIQFFGFKGKINDKSQFKHFTDLLRYVRVNKLEGEKKRKGKEKGEDEVKGVEEIGQGKEGEGEDEVNGVGEIGQGKEGEGEDEVNGVGEIGQGKEEQGEDEVNGVGEKGKGKEKVGEDKVNVIEEEEEKGKEKEKEGQVEVNIVQNYRRMEFLYNAEKLHREGIKFKVIEEEFSLDVTFENGYLELPSFVVHDGTEIEMRNIMALEQCHYSYQSHVCSYIFFLDHLIDTDN